MASSARERFKQVKRAVARLHEVQLMIMNDCDDWRPPSVKARRALADPTASAAIRHVDELEGKLLALRAEETELIDFIGEALVIIQAVRDGLGDKYANLLEWRYIDGLSLDRVRDEYQIPKTTGQRITNIAFDWIDSIGLARILAGDLEI